MCGTPRSSPLDSGSPADAMAPPDGSRDAGADATTPPDAVPDADAQSLPRFPIVHGDYAGALRDASANVIDVPATVARLANAHVDTYAYLIYRDPQNEWDTLPAFLGAAAQSHINVWVYLVPPTEVPGASSCAGGSYPPYQMDYVAWAKQIATLSLSHPNLTGFAIDDFGYNTPLKPGATCKLFSKSYVHQMVQAAKAIAPAMGFWPVLYWPDLEGQSAVIAPLRADVAGVIFPFRDGKNADTYVTSTAAPEIETLGAELSCLRDYKNPERRQSGCFQIHYPWGTPSTAGAYGSLEQTASISGPGPFAIDFSWQHDFAGTTSGYVFAQLLVDGAVVWQQDIGSVGRYTWRKVHVDLPSSLAQKTSATIDFRVTHVKGVSNFGQTVWFDEVKASGFSLQNGDFENGGAGWTTSASSAAFDVAPVRTTSLVTMIYAATLSSDTAHPPTASYVGAVLDAALPLSVQGYSDGAMTYVLGLQPPDNPIYTAVQAAYAPADAGAG